MTNITDNDGGFRAIGAAKLSASAKYIATLMLATGSRSAAELKAISGLAKTTIYRVLTEIFESEIAEIFVAIPISPDCPASPAYGNCSIPSSPADGNITEKTVPIVPLAGLAGLETGDAENAAYITTRATKELPTEVVSYEEIDSPSSVPPKPKTKGTRLAVDWTLPHDWRQWALQRFVHCDDATVSEVAEQFRDFWIAKTGQSATKLDWEATWRNWCRNAKELTGIPKARPINGGRMAYDEAKAARVAKLREHISSKISGAVQ